MYSRATSSGLKIDGAAANAWEKNQKGGTESAPPS